MRRKLLTIFCFITCLISFAREKSIVVTEKQNNQIVSFIENKGQVSDRFNKPRMDILFSGTAQEMVFHLRKDGISYMLNRIDSWKKDNLSMGFPIGDNEGSVPDKRTVYQVDINWLNCNTSAQIIKGNALAGYNNYYLEVCPNGVHEVKSFKDVTYRNLYEGIDLKWYQKNGTLKYDYLVAAGTDYKQI